MTSSMSQSGGVGNPAQLLPLLIGILSFIRVLFLLYVDRTGRFGAVWRWDANNRGQHVEQAQQDQPIRFLGMKIQGLMRPAAPQTRANTGDFEDNMAARHSPDRPWWKRHLVGMLPWLSVFDLWRRMESGDLEQSTVREKMELVDNKQADVKGERNSDDIPSGSGNTRHDIKTL